MRLSLEKKIVGGFVLALSLLSVLGVASYRGEGWLVEELALVRHTQEVLTYLESLMSGLTDAETGQRGFVITGDERFLEPYQQGIQAADGNFRRLRQLTANKPGQQSLLDAIAPLIAQRLGQIHLVVELRRERGFEAAQHAIAAGTGKETHDRLRAAVTEMKQVEEGLLTERATRAGVARLRAHAITIGTALVALLLLSLALALILHDVGKRQRAEEALQRSHESLESRIEQRTAQLVQEKAALRQSESHLRTILDTEPECVKLLDREGNLLEMNRAGLAMIEASSADQVIGHPVYGVVAPEYRQAFQALNERVFQGESGTLLFEVIGFQGTRRWLHTDAVPLRDASGAVSALLGITRDVTESKRAEEALRQLNANLEERVAKRTVELAAKNDELKGFAYTVAHDLKAPLRGISGYAQELERRHKDGLGDRARFCITQIITASKNLDRLIEDLLKYSRLDAEIPTPTDVNLRELVQGILRDRGHALTEQGVEVTVAVPALSIRAWERGLYQVLTNLIDNAIKYSRKAQPPRLTITAEQSASGCRLSVADNGIGFEMKYHDRLFGLFNRLARADEFEGTGAGLAIVKKVVDKLGGKVYAESAPGQGAKFFVDLPSASCSSQRGDEHGEHSDR